MRHKTTKPKGNIENFMHTKLKIKLGQGIIHKNEYKVIDWEKVCMLKLQT